VLFRGSNFFLTFSGIACFLVFGNELFHPAFGVNNLLFAGEKGMTLGANFNPKNLLRGIRSEGLSAGASNLGFNPLRMNFWLHSEPVFDLILSLSFFFGEGMDFAGEKTPG